MSGLSLRVTLQGGDGLRRADGPALVRRAQTDLAQRLAERTLAAAATQIPVDLGGVIGSGQVAVGDGEAAVQYDAPHALYVHGWLGTAPGTRSAPHWPPKGALAGWAERHGIPEFLVRRGISRHGTELHPFLSEAAKARDGWEQDEQQVLTALAGALIAGGSG